MRKASVVVVLIALVLGCDPRPSSRTAKVVRMVTDKVMVADVTGRAKLPPGMVDLSCDGAVYITQDPDGALYVLFPSWRGRHCNVTGLLYCSKTFTVPPTVFTIRPGTSLPNAAAIPEASGTVDATVESRLEAHWYFVHYGED